LTGGGANHCEVPFEKNFSIDPSVFILVVMMIKNDLGGIIYLMNSLFLNSATVPLK
jgi:hypothetical protein